MLNNIDAYRATFGMEKLREKEHPENIYVQPESKFYLIFTSHNEKVWLLQKHLNFLVTLKNLLNHF